MARFGRYQMLLGEPCRLYHYNNQTNEYEFIGIGYYVGNGFCVRDCFTDIRDNLNKGIIPDFLHYDRYIHPQAFRIRVHQLHAELFRGNRMDMRRRT